MARYPQAILVSCEIPWDERGNLLEDVLRREVQHILHYNLPRTKRVLGGADYCQLVEAVPNLVATKNTGGGLTRAAGLMQHAPELQHFFGEANFPHGCMYGECSLLSSFGPMSPHKAKALFEAGRTQQWHLAFRLQREFHDMMYDLLGLRLAQDRIDGAYDKILVRL